MVGPGRLPNGIELQTRGECSGRLKFAPLGKNAWRAALYSPCYFLSKHPQRIHPIFLHALKRVMLIWVGTFQRVTLCDSMPQALSPLVRG